MAMTYHLRHFYKDPKTRRLRFRVLKVFKKGEYPLKTLREIARAVSQQHGVLTQLASVDIRAVSPAYKPPGK